MKSKIHFSGTILILLVFLIDCVTGMWPKIIGTPDPANAREWGYQLVAVLGYKSWFTYVPYLLVALIMIFRHWPHLLKKLNFDILDIVLLFLYFISCVITTIDYHTNLNMRKAITDVWSYAIVTAFILIVKIIMFLKWKISQNNM